MLNWLEQAWYQQHWRAIIFRWLLSPLTLVFWFLSAFRRYLFKFAIKKSHRIDVPVLIVGNISVGGNGKTPLVVWLAKCLRLLGYKPGVLSRGYGGGNTEFPKSVTASSTAADVGDEPILMVQHIGCPLVVDPDRARGAKYLVEQHHCDMIICDDGLQHYALQRDIEIAVIDGQRRLGNGCLLPMGPLREGKWRLSTVDIVVCNGGVAGPNEHLMTLQPSELVNIKDPNKTMSLADLKKPVVAAAAIGNPSRFFDLLRANQLELKRCLSFADHHQFIASDLPQETVLMTEKDAVKCREFAHHDWWYLPVKATLTELFQKQLLEKLKSIN
jgi:tetraacyldisaccharide 4'-kinase